MTKRTSLSSLLMALIILLAIFLRFHKINENIFFNGELGQNYLAIRDAYLSHQIPLLGPPTSHPWLSFGPLFYYIFGPFLILNKWNPNTGPYFFGVVSIISIIANYYLVKKYFNLKTALISSFLIAILPSWREMAYESRFFSLVTYMFYPFLFITLKMIEKQSVRNLFLLGLVFGIMINFHLTPIFLIPAVIIFLFPKRKNIKLKQIFGLLLGFIIPNIPFLIYNLKTSFEMITKFAVWIPYRSVIYHNFNLLFTLNEINNFFGGIFVLVIILFTLFMERKNKTVQVMGLFLLFGIVALILHKDPPSHYFYVLYSIPIILVSFLISKLKIFLIVPTLILIAVISFTSKNKISEAVPYKTQIGFVERIIKDANGREYNLKRIGYSDQFDDYYEQNYDYLLWIAGNEPKKYPTNLTYTINENK